MTKTQLKLQRLEARCMELNGARRYLLRVWMLILEIFVSFHKLFSVFFKGKHTTFEQFAKRSSDGSYSESFTKHEKFRKTSISSAALALVLTVVYVTSGIFVPNKISIRAASFAVNDLSDGGDGICDETCTLRDALEEANANGSEPDSIGFDVAGTISIGAAFSNLAAGGTYIDGDTDGNGTPNVVIDATSMGSGSVFNITSSGNTIHGMIIQNAPETAITINGNNNTISSNYIGTNAAGTAAAANSGPGIFIVGASTGNVIGGNTSATRNVISGNAGQGILLDGAGVSGNTISGNYIGTNAAGTAAIPNTNYGVSITNGAHDNTVGGDLSGGNPGTGLGNIIAGNSSIGVSISNTNTNSNTVAGNLIGLAADGTTGLGNGDDGVNVGGSNSGNIIGGASANFRNVISGQSTADGVDLESTSNTAQNNYIGTNMAGTGAVPNRDGVFLAGTSNVVRDNLVSGNTYQGVRIYGATGATVAGNIVGLNASGNAALANGQDGISFANSAQNNTVGGTSASDRNIVSGNTETGVEIGGGGADESGMQNNTVEGNYIGTNISGNAPIPNGTYGVMILGGTQSNTVGGATLTASCSGACNLISGNTTADVRVEGAAHGNSIQGNVIGLNLDATAPIRWNNEATGVSIAGGAYGNTLGGNRDENLSQIGEGNVIGGYISDVDLDGSYIGDGVALAADAYNVGTSTGNSIFGNLIGLNPAGATQDSYTNTTGALGTDNINDFRSRNGISVLAPYTVIGDGTANHRNVITGNAVGVYLQANSGIHDVSINGNYVGTDKTGELAQKSGGYTENSSFKFNFGIWASGTDTLTVRDNVLSGFQQVTVEGSKNTLGMALVMGYFGINNPNGDNTNAVIAGNKIGTDKDGASSIGNYIGFVCEQLANSTVGGVGASDRNIISGNGSSGSGVTFGTIALGEDNGCHDVLVKNNYFGTDIAGTSAIANNTGLSFQKYAHDLNFDSNLFGEASSISFTGADTIQLSNNVFGVGSDGTTRFSGGNADLSLLQSSNVTVSSNQFGSTDGKGISVDSSSAVTIDGNYLGTNSTKTASYGMLGGVTLVGGSGVNVTNNTLRNIGDPMVDKYLVANSEFSYGGNDYTETWGSNGFTSCAPSVVGMNTLYYSTGLATVYTGNICGQTQAFTGITHVSGQDMYLNDVKAYLISKAGHYYTMLVSQSAGGPFTCSYIATNTFSGGTCDKEFTLFTLGGSTYTTNTLPSGVSPVTDSPDPSMTKYEYTSGISIVGNNGGTLIQGNELSSLARGIYVIGGTDITLDNNNIHDNSGNGIILTETTADVVTKNTISSSGNNGIELSKATANAIGGIGNGNTISGEDLNGIALLANSNDNTVSTNSLSGNGNVGTLNGAGIYINESSSNTFYNNNSSNNVRGFALSSSDAITSTDNIIGGTGTNQANTANDNSSSGILIQGSNTQGNTISGNTISSNDAYGIDNSDTHIAGATTPLAGDNSIQHNTISANILSGIRNYGASPAITNSNIISGNTEYGIKNVVDYGASTNPDTASDDILSEPNVSGNTLNSNHLYGIYSLDTAPDNKTTLATDNTFDNGNEQGRVRQEWYGLVQALADGTTPEADATVQVFGNGQNDALTQFTTATNGFGPSSSSLTDAQTWQAIPEFEVSPSGTLQNYSPHRIFATGSAGTAIFAFDGSVKTATDFGNINGRYQVASVDLTQAPNTISGKVFLDTDKNGSIDSGEAGAANITVTLYMSSDNVFGDDSVIGTPLVTGTNGSYEFTNIPQGKYFVTISVPSGFAATTPNPSNLITFASEAQTETRDFGIASNPVVTANTGTIHGTVFEDTNKNGVYEGGESGIKSVTVKLFEDINGNKKFDEASDEEISTSTSNTSGAFQFNNQPLGGYFLTMTIPSERTLTTDNNPTDVLTLATDGQTITENFGLTPIPGATTPPTEPPPPGGGGTNPITKFISGAQSFSAGLIAPKTGAATANSLVATAAVVIGLINLLAAVPASSWPAASRLLLDGFTEPLLALFGSKKLPWGRLLDSLSKKPVDLGLVRLYDAKSRILLGTAVTDRTGRFKFLPKPGMYKAVASKSGYAFPSSLLSAAPVYEKQNLYFGDQFKIDDMSPTFTKDIPLDPPQAAGDTKTLLKLRAKQTAHNVFAFGGIAISIANMILLFSLLTVGLFLLHAVLLLIFWRLGKPAMPKPWGVIYDQETKKPIPGAVIRIYDQKFGRLLDTAIADRNGKFGFLVGSSSYYLTAEAKGFLFPGTTKATKRDYIGGAITVNEKDKSVAYDIPMKRIV